ncbi:MAG: hypothetical protein ACK5MT_11160 [Actinomycetales bacterium]
MSNAAAAGVRRELLNKVPAITAVFWVIKILSTTVGETFSDYLAVNVGLGPTITDSVTFVALAAALFVQFRTPRYTPWIYWLSVVLISICGTQITDFFTDTLGISLYVSTAVFSVLLALVFVVWYRQEMTLSITSINTPRREAFYWLAILTTFALGTAAGDLATEALGLGFRNGSLIFGAGFLLTLVAWRAGAWPTAAFWAAYILTRPLGASVGDLLTQDQSLGGLGLGAVRTSLLFFAVILVLVVREQLVANRVGARDKVGGPSLGNRRDLAWAAAGAATVILVGGWMSTTVSAPASATAVTAASASSLGDLSQYQAIVSDVQARNDAGDSAGAVTRIKDLEVAWDSAESGLKPRDPKDWHTMDTAIDHALTAVRATPADQAASAKALTALQDTMTQLTGG